MIKEQLTALKAVCSYGWKAFCALFFLISVVPFIILFMGGMLPIHWGHFMVAKTMENAGIKDYRAYLLWPKWSSLHIKIYDIRMKSNALAQVQYVINGATCDVIIPLFSNPVGYKIHGSGIDAVLSFSAHDHGSLPSLKDLMATIGLLYHLPKSELSLQGDLTLKKGTMSWMYPNIHITGKASHNQIFHLSLAYGKPARNCLNLFLQGPSDTCKASASPKPSFFSGHPQGIFYCGLDGLPIPSAFISTPDADLPMALPRWLILKGMLLVKEEKKENNVLPQIAEKSLIQEKTKNSFHDFKGSIQWKIGHLNGKIRDNSVVKWGKNDTNNNFSKNTTVLNKHLMPISTFSTQGNIHSHEGGLASILLQIDRTYFKGVVKAEKKENKLHVSWDVRALNPLFSMKDVLNLWPQSMGSLARTWVQKRLKKCTVIEAFGSGELMGKTWDDLKVNTEKTKAFFNLKEGFLKFLDGFNPAEHVHADINIDSNRVAINFKHAFFNHHTLKGQVSITSLDDASRLNLDLRLTGPFQHLFPLLLAYSGQKDSPLRQVAGQDHTQIKSSFYLKDADNVDDVPIDLVSTVTNMSAKIATMGDPLFVKKGTIQIVHHPVLVQPKGLKKPHSLNEAREKSPKLPGPVLFMKGLAYVNDMKTHFKWTPDETTFHACASGKNLHGMIGFDANDYMENPIIIKGIHRQGETVCSIDLTEKKIYIPWLKWTKKESQPLFVHINMKEDRYVIQLKGQVQGQACLTFSPSFLTEKSRKNEGKKSKQMAVVKEAPTQSLAKASSRRLVQADAEVTLSSDTFALYRFDGHKRHHRFFARTHALYLSPTIGKKDDQSPVSGHLEEKKQVPYQDQISLDFSSNYIVMPDILLKDCKGRLHGMTLKGALALDDLEAICWDDGEIFATIERKKKGNKGAYPNTHNGKAHRTPKDPFLLMQKPLVSRSEKNDHKKQGHLSISIQGLDHNMASISADVTDFGSVMSGLGWTDGVKKGHLRIQGKRDAKGFYTYSGNLYDVTIKNMAIAKLVALVSPMMFTELFSSGMHFHSVSTEFDYDGKCLHFSKLLAKGINLGLIVKGRIAVPDGRMKMKGLVIPSYFLNTFFGYFPLVGAFFGGDKGLISSEFTCLGTLENPIFTLKPMSIFKVGIMKEIFRSFKKSKKKNKRNNL